MFTWYANSISTRLRDWLFTNCIAEKIYLAQIPADPKLRWITTPPIIEELKAKAKARGLWNLFLSKSHYPDVGVPLTNVEVCLFGSWHEIFNDPLTLMFIVRCHGRDHGEDWAPCQRSYELLCSGYWQHG